MSTGTQQAIDWDMEFDLPGKIQEEPQPAVTPGSLAKSILEHTVSPVLNPEKSPTITSDNAGTLYFDIETVPDYDRQSSFNLPPLPTVPDEIAEENLLPVEQFLTQTLGEIDSWFSRNNPCESWLLKLEEAERKASGKKGNRKGLFDAIAKSRSGRNAVEDAVRQNRKTMSCTPEMCKIVAIGFAVDDSAPQSLVVGVDGVTEADALATFWSLVRKCERVCGFNVKGFDLPVIFVRSILLGVPASRLIDMTPHRGQVLDLMVERFGRNPQKGQGLKQTAKAMGIDIPAEGMDGSQVEVVYQQNPQLVGHYVTSDIIVTRKLHRLGVGYFWI